jgi:MFS family permease
MAEATETNAAEAAAKEASDAFPAQHGGKLWTRTFVVLMLVNFGNFFGFFMLLPTLSIFLTQEGTPHWEIGIVIGSFTVFSIMFRILSVWLARRAGAVRSVRLGLITVALGTLFFFLIHKTESYIFARLLQGAGFGVTSTLISSLAAEITPPSRMAEGLGYMGLANTLAMVLGPLAGTALSTVFGFGAMFSAMSAFSLAAAGVTLLLPPIRLFYLPPELTKKKKRGLHLDRRPLAPASLAILYGASTTSVTAYLAVYAADFHLPSAACFFLVSAFGTIAARLTTGKIYDHRGDRLVIPPAALVLAAGFLLVLVAGNGSRLVYYLAAVVYGFGIGSVFPSIQTLAFSSVPHSRRSAAVSTFFVCSDLGNGLGAVLLGFLAGWAGGYRVVFAASVLCAALVLLVYAWFYIVPSHRMRHILASKREDDEPEATSSGPAGGGAADGAGVG